MTFEKSTMRRLVTASALLLLFSHVNAAGYHYGPPSPLSAPARPPPNSNSGHFFPPIPTTVPLPPVPSIPLLPTGRPQVQRLIPAAPVAGPRTHTQSLVQVHPASSAAPRPAAPQQRQQQRPPTVFSSFRPPVQLQPQPQPQPQPQVGYSYAPPTASAPSAPTAPLQPQPLRVPFGQQPIYKFGTGIGPDSDFYVVNGRQLKQYAVVEFVDNDISQDTKPFLTRSFVNNYRALVGASGTGAIAPLPSAMQLDSTANAILREQQRLEFRGATARGDTIALGSGGIGFVRLPDGSVTLGSGSLNFVTGQQHLADLRAARTRSESQRDPLHFGHGPLEEPNNRFLFK
ncbi:protein diaphanous homolog 1 isoform X2 [Ceratitis capitata]|nr:protein diaphanous homolog 1 isoform X2 [Ceratitis capitata]XP_020715985.1 protein diaphanous homolog 1 isoform X2 [Ceratitis capitata]